ncbi:Glycoside hydrolase superfamily [Phytophthora cactorum]|nr:Glycoside hydrolase superfamily [Phytophthora cactorum]
MKFFLPTLVASALLILSSKADALNVKMHGINYNSRKGPDWAPDSSKCKTASEVQKDMYALKGITDRVRIYSLLDCSQAELVLPAAKNAGLQVYLGLWTTKSHDYLLKEKAKLASLIDSGVYDNNVIVCMSEITADTAISYMNEIRSYIRSRGKNTPVTIADVIDTYYDYPQMVDAVDYISGVDVNEGAAKTLDRIRAVRVTAAKKNKRMVLSEVGWSSGGYNAKTGAKFFSDFFQVARSSNMEYYWYTAFDSQWRVTNGGEDVEANFGVFKEDDSMKSNFQQLTIGWKDPRVIRNAGSNRLLSEKDAGLYMSTKSNDWLVQEQQTWFIDSVTKQVRSKSGDRCLDAYQPWDGGIVHVYRCMDNEGNQKWTYESSTGKLKHATHQGFCLDSDPAQGNKVQLYGCSPNNPNQKWAIINPANI